MDVEIEHPHVQHHKTGHRGLDFALPLAALFVSFVSIFIAWHHGQVMKELVHQNEKLVEANSLPYLQIYGSNGPNGAVSLNVVNQGIGPARIATAEILVDDKPVQRLRQILTSCCGSGEHAAVSSSTLLGRMIRPGDIVPYVEFHAGQGDRADAHAFDVFRRSGRIKTRLCYCSVFEDCWTVTNLDPTPVSVNECKAEVPLYRE